MNEFQVLCEKGTRCGNGNECGATFSLSRRDADGLPRVSEVYEECGSAASSEAATTATAHNNNSYTSHRGTAIEHESSAIGNIRHEARDLL